MGSARQPDTTPPPPPAPSRPLPLSDPTASWFQDWYYKIELEPGVVTDGKDYPGQIPIRLLLRGIDVAGQRCLDVGAMEGVMSILMERRQAARVVAYDRMPNDQKVKTVREKLGAKFEYIAGMELPDMPRAVSGDGSSLFDVVVCGGLLYHAFDPLTALCRVRGMVRPGGLLLLETAAVLEQGYGMYFNAEGAIYNACSNFWFPSVGCLDYLVRYLRLRPLDCCYVYEGYRNGARPRHRTVRVAIVLRAETVVLAAADDPWMRLQGDFDSVRNFFGLVDWSSKSDLPPVSYTLQNGGLAYRRDPRCVDVESSVGSLKSVETPENARLTTLRLSDLY
jgi:SAM-dependent methyltransferase